MGAAVLAAGIGALPPCARTAAAAEPGDRVLLVGINHYRAPGNELSGSVTDVANMRRFLLDQMGFRDEQIHVLTDGQATADNIRAEMRTWLVQGSRPGARVWFHYSGHGHQLPDDNGDEADGLDEVLVAHDAAIGPAGPVNFIRDDEIGAMLDQLTDRQVTLVVDACHSGTITRGFGDPAPQLTSRLATFPTYSAPSTPGAGRSVALARAKETSFAEPGNRPGSQVIAWTAVSPNQKALEDPSSQPSQGVFTRRFIAGLTDKAADRNRDGIVSNAELLDYVLAESEVFCRRYGCTLTPTLEAPKEWLDRDAVSGRPSPTTQAAGGNLLSHTNGAGVSIEVLPGPRTRLGDTVAFRVGSARDGYLLVLDINAAQAVTQIFPNRFSERQGKGNRIFAGRPISIPDPSYGFAFTASEPVGRGTLIAIVTEDPVSLEDVAGRHRDLTVVADPQQYLRTIADRLRHPWIENDGNTRTTTWSSAQTSYEITR